MRKEMEAFVSLNTDIAFDVLSRFPVKDLLELKSVSKGWRCLISDQTFIRTQSQKKEPLSGFFFQQRFQWCPEDIKTISYIPVEWKGTKLPQEVFDFLPEDAVVLTSCNGLVCCRSCYPFEKPAIYVCNPLKKEWEKLDFVEPDKASTIALAFDPLQDFAEKSANFKLVRPCQTMTEKEDAYFSFDIYSSKTRKWKKSQEICWCQHNLHKNKGIFIAGVLHWLTSGDQILTFNVESELAWLIPAPFPAIGFNSIPEVCIGESEGRLHYVMISEEGLQVWSLEDCFESSWSLQCSKSLAEMEKEHPSLLLNLHAKVSKRTACAVITPLAFGDGTLLLRLSRDIYLYDINSGKLKEVVDISKFGSNTMFPPIVVPYSMSLIPLKGD